MATFRGFVVAVVAVVGGSFPVGKWKVSTEAGLERAVENRRVTRDLCNR